MAKQLLLVRHGKAEAYRSASSDFERALTRIGHEDAADMASRFIEKGVLPDRIISSPANRALTTAKHFAKIWNISSESIKTDESIYEAKVKDLLTIINGFDDSCERIAMFGHNPSFTELANYLVDDGMVDIPTAGLVWIEFPFDSWSMISGSTGTLLLFDYPRDSQD